MIRQLLIERRISIYLAFCFFAAALGLCSRVGAVTPAPPIAWSVTTDDTYWPDVTPAPGGGVYVATSDINGTGALVRRDSLGAQVWRQAVPAGRPMTTVVSDSSGNALLAGYRPSFPNDAYLLKYNPAGNLQWTQTISSPVSDWPTGLGVDSAGNAYFSEGPWATNYGVPPAGTYSTLRRFNSDGQLAWLDQLNTQDGTYPGNGWQAANDTVVGHNGYVFTIFSNYSKDANNVYHSHEYFTKTSLGGQVQFIKPIGELSGVGGIGVDSNDNVYATFGYTLKKFDSVGNEVWSISNSYWALGALTVGPNDEIYVAGRADYAPYIAQYDVNGILQWNDIQPVGPDVIINYTGLTVSGNKLIGSATVAEQGTYTHNLLRAYQLVPEPSAWMFLFSLAFLAPVFRCQSWAARH